MPQLIMCFACKITWAINTGHSSKPICKSCTKSRSPWWCSDQRSAVLKPDTCPVALPALRVKNFSTGINNSPHV